LEFDERPGRSAVLAAALPPFTVDAPGDVTFKPFCDSEQIANRVLTVSAPPRTAADRR
jgi:hypothetical protein